MPLVFSSPRLTPLPPLPCLWLPLLPLLFPLPQAFGLIAGALQSCPLSMQQVRQAAAGMLAEQRRQTRQQQQEAAEEGGAATATATAAAADDVEGELDASEEEMREALMAASAELPGLLTQVGGGGGLWGLLVTAQAKPNQANFNRGIRREAEGGRS